MAPLTSCLSAGHNYLASQCYKRSSSWTLSASGHKEEVKVTQVVSAFVVAGGLALLAGSVIVGARRIAEALAGLWSPGGDPDTQYIPLEEIVARDAVENAPGYEKVFADDVINLD